MTMPGARAYIAQHRTRLASTAAAVAVAASCCWCVMDCLCWLAPQVGMGSFAHKWISPCFRRRP
jgi:hypothetical protein|eukprot:COSAG01_NODE_6112_length_3843_cov_9.524306_3_plen_64_part_00